MDQVEDLVERQRFDPFAEILTEGPKVCTPVIERADGVERSVFVLEDTYPVAINPRLTRDAVCGH